MLPKSFYKWMFQFTLLPTMYKSSICSSSLPTLDNFCLSNIIPSGKGLTVLLLCFYGTND